MEADTAQEDGLVVQIDIFTFYIKVTETNLLVEPVTFRSDGYIDKQSADIALGVDKALEAKMGEDESHKPDLSHRQTEEILYSVLP